MTDERGTALLEVIVLGFAVVMLVLPIIMTVARITEAQSLVHSAARDGALWVARHGGDPPAVDGIELHTVAGSNVIEVVATDEVDLIGVGGTTLARTVSATVEVPISAYRSRR